MPIGKNAIKRVENNGYSKVETKAPDMENSSVIANLDAQVEEKIIAPIVEKTEKPAKRKYVKRKNPTKKEAKAPEKPAKRKYTRKPKTGKDGFVRVEVGEGMPYYLL